MTVTRLRYLEEMGLGPVWVLRAPAPQPVEVPPPAQVVEEPAVASVLAPPLESPTSSLSVERPPEAFETSPCESSPARPAAGTAPAAGLLADTPPVGDVDGPPPDLAPPPYWDEEPLFFTGEDFPSPPEPGVPPREAEIAVLDWAGLRRAVAECRACALCQKRKQAVLGVGDESPEWLVVGEGPGAEEDEKGEPFVGQAGKLLDNMLAALGLRRGQGVYIGNAVKCRPPGNRTPEPAEIAACFPFLRRQIALLQPKIILALGRPAAQALLDTEIKIGAARGRLFDYQGIPVVVSYHPAYLLRNTADKAKAWEDLCFARATLRRRAQR